MSAISAPTPRLFRDGECSPVLSVLPSISEMASLQRKGVQARILSSEEEEKLKRDQGLVSDFKQQKLEKEAQKNWDLFYKRNSTNFFKDRHWTTREFEELRSCREFEDQKLTVLEAGCGVGNCLFPLLEEDVNIFAYACDFSPRAVEYVKQNPLYNTERCKVFQCDLTKDDLLDHILPESVDVVMLIFVLSAIHPEKMHCVLQNVYKVLKPGKSVLFRDYGIYDHAMLRFKASSKLGENFYVRQDGTRSYFFTDEFLAQLFTDTGYKEVINEYVFRETVNKKEDLCVPRVFLQSKFQKPPKNPAPVTLDPGHES
ncbi:tRNA N(3)-methylcytidine methyltransferase METTL6 [Nycticebus coucang]|uniref:tRNA N(3)-methylcytidine methyltransferase METTL6 n=1 Tax=Nycticebus coucang TaxID=9470 RepID=UPI00234CF204|nr:tRNA N(3)-methylcytidine methyltransferase METTL6 [Nycticebus coucang]XP_053454995.1 tRNA N(3)-methylcytidine methyltransferase METTL6 [Nycticebus coucang]XP_053454996.1 tRNA N(3)-methylcytidine methyltransferase METTL6 [Nycticebus coucang]XP_053454997.1 tRNA N(3)-methylcytidine methyltransferase METTL6 [Nycticebus coucang]XP_053454998.1 tRNA N(3)-methylcytidine methyltransferase METTL6 [Nycticebus coucang]XP_053454999.1 tRNA N(3)-methylcytidine methyltransferase METTL6 [Nycticebus coucang]